jgi:DNA primase
MRCKPVVRLVGHAVLALAAAASLGACSVEPWVKPYERDHLADPIMSFDRDPVSSSYMGHVYEAREGARGATGAAGGGCGCN